MATMIEASQKSSTCTAAACRRAEHEPAVAGFTHRQCGSTYHVWLRGDVAIVLDCHNGGKTVTVDGVVIANVPGSVAS